MLDPMMGFYGLYSFFFGFCLIPSILLGIIFQYLVSRQATRKFAVPLLTVIALVAGIFINYYVLGVPLRDKIYFPILITITLSTLIISSMRSYFLNRSKCYVNSFTEVVKNIMFAMFVTPIVMPFIFFHLLVFKQIMRKCFNKGYLD